MLDLADLATGCATYTHLCSQRRNQNKAVKTKSRHQLECEADLRFALSSTKPRIKLLVSKKQLHPSHLSRIIANKLLFWLFCFFCLFVLFAG